ncbi:MAG: hypothetical protein AB1942_19895 [Pseudomonadota bacterium]
MSRGSRTDKAMMAVRFLAALSVALGLMCAGLAWMWQTERETAACWKAAAEFQLQPEGDCRG